MGDFQSAVPVRGKKLSGEYNQFLGFHTEIESGKRNFCHTFVVTVRLPLEEVEHAPDRSDRGSVFIRTGKDALEIEKAYRQILHGKRMI